MPTKAMRVNAELTNPLSHRLNQLEYDDEHQIGHDENIGLS